MSIIQIPLSKLHLSPANVRKTDTQLFIDELAANIGEHGLLQNLIVAPMVKPKGHYSVTGGGRRLRAMNRLVELGGWKKDAPVSCRAIAGEASTQSEISYTENFMQLKMTPTDEIRAFKHFINEGSDLDAIAKRLSVTRRHIEGRLRLADLAEPVFAALDEGTITLDVAKAYASTASHERQLMVWEEVKDSWQASNADAIRRMIAHASLPSISPIARFVGEADYLAAGGRIEADLFRAEQGDKWIDSEIAMRIAGEKLQDFAVEVANATGLGWVRPLIGTRVDHMAVENLHRVWFDAEPLDDDEKARIEAIETEIAGIEAKFEEGVEADEEQLLEARHEALQDEARSIADKPAHVPDAVKPLIGCFVLVSNDGEAIIDATLYSETPLRRNGELPSNDPVGGASGAGVTGAAGDGTTVAPDKADKPLSQKLVDELAVQRRDVLAAHLALNPAIALDYLIFAIADKSPSYGSDAIGSSIRAGSPGLHIHPYPVNSAQGQLADIRDTLDMGWTEQAGSVERFAAFAALDDQAKAAWVGFAVARTLEASLGVDRKTGQTGAERIRLHDHLAALMEVDAAQHWRPTAANYFDRVSKPKLLAHIGEVGGSVMAAGFINAKKAELAASCEKLFAGDTIVEPEVKAAALGWVPQHMRFNTVAVTDDLGAEQAGDDETEALQREDAADEPGADQTDAREADAEREAEPELVDA